PRAGRGYSRGGDGGGHRVDVGDLRAVPRRAGALAEGHQLRGLRRPFRPSHVCDGRARVHGAGDGGRPRRDEARAGRCARGGGGGGHPLPHPPPRADPPPAGCEPAGGPGPGGAAGRGAGGFEMAGEDTGRDPDRARDYQQRLRDLAVDTGVPVTWGMFSSRSAPDLWRPYFDLLDETARAGGRMFAQVHSRALSVLLSFETRLPFDRLPEWRGPPPRPPPPPRAPPPPPPP